MNDLEEKLILELALNSISKNEFLKKFPVKILENTKYLKDLLETALRLKDPDLVENALILAFTFDLVTIEHIAILCDLLSVEWHREHENIAMLLQQLKAPRSVESLYNAALTKYEYLNFDDSYALAVKCIWALGDINTDLSRGMLDKLSKSENEIIKENALKQLKRTEKNKSVFDSFKRIFNK